MRGPLVLTALALLALSFAGCIGGPGVAAVGLFSAWNLPEGDPAPVPATDCADLLQTLNQRALAEADASIDRSVAGGGSGPFWWGGNVIWMDGDMALQTTGAYDAASTGSTQRDAARADVTGTNNQEAGVDEADVLKTDGEWTYVLQAGRLYILHSDTVGDIEAHTVFDTGARHSGGMLLLEPRDPDDPDDDRLIVITSAADPAAGPPPRPASSPSQSYVLDIRPGGGDHTRILVFDLADRADPKILEELWIEGSGVGARLIDGTAYLVVRSGPGVRLQTHVSPYEDGPAPGLDWQAYYAMNATERQPILQDLARHVRAANNATIENATLADHLPSFYRNTTNGPQRQPVDTEVCQRYLSSENTTGRTTSTILALSVGAEEIQEQRTHIIGSNPILYAAEDALVLAESTRDTWWFWRHQDRDEATDIHWFDLDGLDVTHRASGRVAGIVHDSFGIDVHDGTFRVITTTGEWGRWWIDEPEPRMSHVALFEESDGRLVPLGMVGGIAPRETLFSARFTDDRAYLVTFEQIDPLWIVDIADPRAPKILGELEIPGVSTYIHPLSEDLLLTIGHGARASGRGIDGSRIQVSLFDISDPTKPTRAAVLDLTSTDGWSSSSAIHEHKAFTYWDRLGMLAIPLSTVSHQDGQYRQHVGLSLVKVDTEAGSLKIYGEIDQDALIPAPVADDTGGTHAYHWSTDIQRSYFLGHVEEGIVSVYAMSALGMTAHDLATLRQQDALAFRLA